LCVCLLPDRAARPDISTRSLHDALPIFDSAPAHAAAFRAALAEYAPSLLGSFRYESYAGATTREVVTALGAGPEVADLLVRRKQDRKSTRLNSSHVKNSYAVFCLKKKDG